MVFRGRFDQTPRTPPGYGYATTTMWSSMQTHGIWFTELLILPLNMFAVFTRSLIRWIFLNQAPILSYYVSNNDGSTYTQYAIAAEMLLLKNGKLAIWKLRCNSRYEADSNELTFCRNRIFIFLHKNVNLQISLLH